ncbi:granzyme B-like [Xyrauchen texanus]|uniref:granzyme B-like n=1 Tax=Xyrauchen texanus TaxID=154827 RepID=UPI0022424FAA|nr:granzyme B-like [Xyrauchen texanus]
MFLYIFLIFFGISVAAGMESGITGGKEAKLHSRPYMASLQNNGHHTCGGMLIKRDYVLTSAHCLNEFTVDLVVVLGAHNISTQENSQQKINVRKYIRHPLFEQNNYSHDIMLLKLKTKAKINKFVKVMPLPKKNGKTLANMKCSIAGWGIKNPKDDRASSVLREVTLKLQENSQCKKKWQEYFNSDRMICSVSDGKDAFCQGDSGSPLICNTKPQAIATFTFDGDCTNKKYPEVYVKIGYFLPWIKKMIGKKLVI